MSQPTILARVIVGSHLHGLAMRDSDTDVRRVWVSSLADILSPWPLEPPEMEPEEDGWELRHFVGLIVKGNPTVLEVLASDLTLGPVDSRWLELRHLTPAMLDPVTVHRAHTGYIVSQEKLIVDARRRGDERRASKAAVAALRIADQGADLLRTGVLTPKVTRYRDLLIAIRADGLGGERETEWRHELDLAVAGLDGALSDPHPSLALDRPAVLAFLASGYRWE
jgi:hypothetical protein